MNKQTKYVGVFMMNGWREPMKMYSFYCDICKRMVVNYIMGHNKTLVCPICLANLGENKDG